MGRNSTFNHYRLKIDKDSRKTLNIASFGGIDFSSQRFNVESKRAIDAKNFIYRDGVIQKRFGYEELYLVPIIKYIRKPFDNDDNVENVVQENTRNFNGIWCFLAEDGERHIIAHIGKLLFEVEGLGTNNLVFNPIYYDSSLVQGRDEANYYRLAYEYEDYKSFAFVGSNRFWFLGGNKYMCLRYVKNNGITTRYINIVEDGDETFIPTTTISITYKNATTSGRSNLDYTNLLTMWRKNQFISGVGKEETEKTKTPFFDYTLDAPLITKNRGKDMAKVSIVIKERGEIANV